MAVIKYGGWVKFKGEDGKVEFGRIVNKKPEEYNILEIATAAGSVEMPVKDLVAIDRLELAGHKGNFLIERDVDKSFQVYVDYSKGNR